MGSETYHEPYEQLSPFTRNLHRAIVSLIEELDAVDWYTQRAEVCDDPELKATLLHHRNEEVEHAMMNLEWLRRNMPVFEENMRTYLFSSGPITEVEEAATGGPGERGSIERESKAKAVGPGPARAGGALGVGSLRNP